MRKNYFLLFLAMSTFGAWTVNAQYCSPTILCDVEEITNVTFVEINNTTPGCAPFIDNDFTDQVASVVVGETYEISVTVTLDPAFPSDYLHVFIDWDQNEVLNDAGEAYTLVGPSGTSGTYTMDIEVPVDAVLGETRMRVLVNYFFDVPDPCVVSNYAEAEDYTVSVGTLGISENAIEGFSFYPNPASDVLNLNALNNIDALVIYNTLGQEILEQKVGNTSSEINVSNLKTGIYLMKVTSNGQMGTYTLIKN